MVLREVNPKVRNQVWQGLLDSEMQSYYFTELAGHYRKWRNRLRVIILASVIIEASLIYMIPSLLSGTTGLMLIAVITVFIIVVVIFDSVNDFSAKVANLSWLCTEVADLNSRWHSLWIDIERYSIEEDDVLAKQKELLGRYNAIVGRVDISVDRKLNVEAEALAFNTVKERYAN